MQGSPVFARVIVWNSLALAIHLNTRAKKNLFLKTSKTKVIKCEAIKSKWPAISILLIMNDFTTITAKAYEKKFFPFFSRSCLFSTTKNFSAKGFLLHFLVFFQQFAQHAIVCTICQTLFVNPRPLHFKSPSINKQSLRHNSPTKP